MIKETDNNTAKHMALLKYLMFSKYHQEAEAKLPDNEFLPFDFSLIADLNKHFNINDVGYFISHKNELIKQFLLV